MLQVVLGTGEDFTLQKAITFFFASSMIAACYMNPELL
jgi:hypothetical protein